VDLYFKSTKHFVYDIERKWVLCKLLVTWFIVLPCSSDHHEHLAQGSWVGSLRAVLGAGRTLDTSSRVNGDITTHDRPLTRTSFEPEPIMRELIQIVSYTTKSTEANMAVAPTNHVSRHSSLAHCVLRASNLVPQVVMSLRPLVLCLSLVSHACAVRLAQRLS
jgi:hypothetical protein